MTDNINNDLIPVEGHNNLFRDRNTGAILNNDKSSYLQYMRLKEQRQREKNELEQIKKDIDEIKSLLRELTNGNGSR
jgi:vesicle coat complex subunit